MNRVILSLATLTLLASCAEAPKAEKPQATYKIMTVSRQNTSVAKEYPTVINGQQSVEIRPQVAGVITNILIDEGEDVKRGDVMFIIDQVPYKAALKVAQANEKSAQAQVATAELNLKSSQELYDEGVVSEYDLQSVKNALLVTQAALAQAEAQVTIAQNDLEYTRVTSPVTGTTSMINYRVGALVNSSITTPLVTVSDNKTMHAYFSLTEGQMLALLKEEGNMKGIINRFGAIELSLGDNTIYSEKGNIDAISGSIDATTGSIKLRAAFANPDGILRDGGNGRVVVATDIADAIIIPARATFEIQNKRFVYKVVDGKTESAEIRINPLNDGKEYIVESGIEAGDIIIAEGAGLLRSGMVIEAQNESKK